MKRLTAALAATLATLALAASAQADPSEYGIEEASASLSTLQAGAHPDFTSKLALKREPGGELPSATRDLFFRLPAGLLGNPNAVPKCTAAQLVNTDVGDKSNKTGCPQASQVGVTEVELFIGHDLFSFLEPIYNMEPRFGEPARFGFIADFYPIMIDLELRSGTGDDYGVTARLEGLPTLIPLLSAETTFWGLPADESHDAQRITPYEAFSNNGTPETPSGKRPSDQVPVPFMVNPTSCGTPLALEIRAIPYVIPSMHPEVSVPMGQNSGCGLVDFKPSMTIAPTSSEAESATGLDVHLEFPGDGFEQPNLRIGSAMKRAEVTLPVGITANPSQAVGLGVCSPADFAKETAFSVANEGCPDTAKIGTVTATSPLSEETAEGGLFIAKPHDNPFDSLLALYLILKIPDQGVIVKLAGKVEPDPKTGQLITTFDDLPQLPVSAFDLHFREGARAPLVTPPRCGSYEATAKFTPFSDPNKVITTHPSFQITRGVSGGACPSGDLFGPTFTAGSQNDNAGSYSPFYMRLTRNDGDQDLTRFSATLPPGVVAKLAGVSMCPDQAIEAAKAKSGKAEQASPSCPATSQIGHVLGGAGVGQVLTYAEGKIYLAGPYQGAPLSVAAIVPAVAGPFDVGTIVTRQALQLNPRTGVVTADGEHSDPLPHILAGIPLKVRDIRVYVDRKDFTLNPTSCDPFQTTAEIWGGGKDVFSSLDDSPLSLADRFQAANCANLGFKPRLSLKLKGGARRGAHPALTGTYRPRKGDANLEGMVLRLPRSAFLDQAHIRTICTRVQFAAHACPAGAVYGHATAYTPLLDQPLQGPVYLRSSNHNLPDFVADLHGLVEVEAVARIDSKGGGIRATFSAVPDAPLTKVVVQMQGAKKGLIVNSTGLCAAAHRADAKLEAHNGKRASLKPQMQADCGAKKHGRRGSSRR
jgi:hypothetical protein